jgi:hypothetical protein
MIPSDAHLQVGKKMKGGGAVDSLFFCFRRLINASPTPKGEGFWSGKQDHSDQPSARGLTGE